ncbi:hypothetical protein [Vibrio rumoiensis]|uniref:Uncharacterized protein n=1 Tax=Vibrio rumoiensis 1S-45 TaxID=1188252 RepID=A0A1E5E4Y9_9VIBR|nr:hypothetical protein [Vibrio rumoiensis]OEF28192.1 hypothetical protein A1QC_06010 [Vibrio rumoiensis 1S-45]
MKSFGSGFNNFFVGLFSGLLLPIVIIMVLLFLTVDKVTSFAQDEAIAPLYQRGAETLDKVDSLITTLDTKVDNASLEDIHLLAPLKDANLFPELKQLAGSVEKLSNAASDVDKQAVVDNLKENLKTSLSQKYPVEKAQQLADNFAGIAEVLASKKEQVADNVTDKKDELMDQKDELVEKAQDPS